MRIHATPENAIATLHRGPFGKVEFLRCNGVHAFPVRSEVATHLHFSLAVVGSFVWHAERESVFADPTALLCTHEGEPYRISHPHGGDQTLVFTPSKELTAQLHEGFGTTALAIRRRTAIAAARAQLIAHTFYADWLAARDPCAADERLLEFFASIAAQPREIRLVSDDPLVRRTIEYVHHTPESSLTLQGIAAAMGVRASHLTHSFSRRTGQPLYRYVMSLKLSRALHRIVATDEDLTDIALDLGFSSHSHLSAAFRRRYGMSPSAARSHIGHGGGARRARSIEAAGDSLVWRPLCAARGGMQSAA